MYTFEVLSKSNDFLCGEIELYCGKSINNKIAVANVVTPFDSPNLLQASAIIVEKGGILNHISIFSREFGITCIKLENATKILKTGQKVKLDLEKKQLIITD